MTHPKTFSQRSLGRALAIALAIPAVAGLALTAQPADALVKKDKKDKKNKKEEGPKYDLSKEFMAAYAPAKEAVEKKDPASETAVRSLMAVAKNQDEQFISSGLLLQVGINSGAKAIQKEALKMSLDSGKTPATSLPQYNFFMGNFSYEDQEYGNAIKYLTEANRLGYTGNDTTLLIFDSYIQDGKPNEGYAYLDGKVAAAEQAGQEPNKDWLTRALASAFRAKMGEQSAKWSYKLVQYYPSDTSWSDALIILQSQAGYGRAETLDVMRLKREVGAMKEQRDYEEYIQSADAISLPAEVVRVIDEGRSAGVIAADADYVNATYKEAKPLVQKDLDSLDSGDKRARATSSGRSAFGMGNAYMSNGMYDKAAEMYEIAISKGDVDTEAAKLRAAIAHYNQGHYDMASKGFAAVAGPREATARLWKLQSDEMAAPRAAAEAAPAEATASAQ